MSLPEPIQNLINNFSRLPGIGPKTASRFTFYLLRAPEDLARYLGGRWQTMQVIDAEPALVAEVDLHAERRG